MEGGLTCWCVSLSRRTRRPDPARVKHLLGDSRGRASLDRGVRRDSTDAGNPAQIQGATMSHENFERLWVLNEQGAARLATYEEIVRAACSVIHRTVRRERQWHRQSRSRIS
jgi:hypothetical protein